MLTNFYCSKSDAAYFTAMIFCACYYKILTPFSALKQYTEMLFLHLNIDNNTY